MGLTEDGLLATSVLTEHGERVFGSKLTESGKLVFGLGGGVAYVDFPGLTIIFRPNVNDGGIIEVGDVRFVVRPAISNRLDGTGPASASVRLIPTVSGFPAFQDMPGLTFVLKILATDTPGFGQGLQDVGLMTVIVRAASSVMGAFVDKPGLTARFRLDVTNGLLFSEVISAVWNESAIVLLDPELLAPIWTAENVLTEGVFGFPGIRNRIQTVRSKVTVQ